MSKDTNQTIHHQVARIASQYRIFECEACAYEIRKWLKRKHIAGTYLTIRARMGDFIISTRVGGHTSITLNGFHYGVEVRGKVFDNLPDTGVSKEVWLNDFACFAGFELTEESF